MDAYLPTLYQVAHCSVLHATPQMLQSLFGRTIQDSVSGLILVKHLATGSDALDNYWNMTYQFPECLRQSATVAQRTRDGGRDDQVSAHDAQIQASGKAQYYAGCC